MRALLPVVVVGFMLVAPRAHACAETCAQLWTCMQQSDLCASVDAQDDFEARCQELDEDQCSVLSKLIDPNECETTLAHLSGVSPGLDELCGFTGRRAGQTNCADRCDELWTCTQADPAWCPDFSPDRESDFKEACTSLAPCDALDVIVDPSNCELTVRVMSTVHDKFGDKCDVDIDSESPFHRADGDIYVYGCGSCRMHESGGDSGWWLWLGGLALALRRRRGRHASCVARAPRVIGVNGRD